MGTSPVKGSLPSLVEGASRAVWGQCRSLGPPFEGGDIATPGPRGGLKTNLGKISLNPVEGILPLLVVGASSVDRGQNLWLRPFSRQLSLLFSAPCARNLSRDGLPFLGRCALPANHLAVENRPAAASGGSIPASASQFAGGVRAYVFAEARRKVCSTEFEPAPASV